MNRQINVKIYENNTLLSANTTNGLLEDNFLSFHTDNDNIRINMNACSFTKENNESLLNITKDRCTLTVKELKKDLELKIEFVEMSYKDNIIEINYQLESQEYPLKITIEIGESDNEI